MTIPIGNPSSPNQGRRTPLPLLWGFLALGVCCTPEPDPPPPTCPPTDLGAEVLVKGASLIQHGVQVTVADFHLDRTEITVSAYRACVLAGRCAEPKKGAPCNFSEEVGTRENHPVNCITFEQAQSYCSFAGKRLPSEAEWELAAAGVPQKRYPWGQDEPAATDQPPRLCWFHTTNGAQSGTCQVGAFPRTLLGSQTCDGVADLAGNVWEWSESEYRSVYQFPETPCTKDAPRCSLRGGAWSLDSYYFFQTIYRFREVPSMTSPLIGARCARSRS